MIKSIDGLGEFRASLNFGRSFRFANVQDEYFSTDKIREDLERINSEKEIFLRTGDQTITINGIHYNWLLIKMWESETGFWVRFDAQRVGMGHEYQLTPSAQSKLTSLYGSPLKALYGTILPALREQTKKDYLEKLKTEIDRIRLNIEDVDRKFI